MKKIGKYLVFVLVLFFGFLISVNAEEQIEIKSIRCDNMYNGELRENVGTEVSGLTIKIDDSYFYKAGDYFKCTLVVKNNAADDVTVDSESISNKSDENITYELKTEGENIIKKGEEKTYNLEINYIKVVEEDKTLENAVEIKLLNDEVIVPDTGVVMVLTISLVLLLIISIGIVIYTKKSAVLMLPIVFALLVIPAGYSLMKVSIKLENKIFIEVDPRYKVIYKYRTFITEEEKDNYYEVDEEPEAFFETKDGLYSKYYVSVLEGYYKEGDIVEVNDMPITSFYCNSWEDSTCLDYELENSTLLTNAYDWKYDVEYNEGDMIEFSGESVECFNNFPMKSESSKYIIKRLRSSDSVCHFNTPTTFVMPGHDVLLYEYGLLN